MLIRTLKLAFIMLLSLPAMASSVYIAQTAGTFSGGTACNGQTAITPATFNASTPAAGDIDYLCGTLTFAAGTSGGIQINGSGSSGNPISLIWDTGAIVQAPYWGANGAVYSSGRSYIAINLGSNGVVKSTANGSGYWPQGTGPLIYMNNVSNLVVECASQGSSCMVGPNYVDVGAVPIASISGNGTTATITCASACPFAVGVNPISFYGTTTTSGSSFNSSGFTVATVSGSTMTVASAITGTATGGYTMDETPAAAGIVSLVINGGSNITDQYINASYAHWCNYYSVPTAGSMNVTIENNFSQYCDHGFPIAGESSGATVSNLILEGNTAKDGYVYDDSPTVDNNHHDGIHVETNVVLSNSAPALIYNNTMSGNWGLGLNSLYYIEGTGTVYEFNNIAYDQSTLAHAGCEHFCITNTPTVYLYNNTDINDNYVGGVLQSNTGLNVDSATSAPSVTSINNIFVNEKYYTRLQNSYSFASDYNDYYGCIAGLSNCWNEGTWAQWNTAGYDAHGLQASNPNLSAGFVPPSTSPVHLAGENLTSLCTGTLTPLCSDAAGRARPASGAWDIGAFNASIPIGSSLSAGTSMAAGTSAN